MKKSKQVLRCVKHPKYKGLLVPRAKCSACDLVYITTPSVKK